MICEELKDIEASTLPTAKLIHIISKNQMIYLKRELEDFDINVSQFHFLIEIGSHKYINQEKIASISNFDKELWQGQSRIWKVKDWSKEKLTIKTEGRI